MYCPSCAVNIHDGSHFCASCGARLKDLLLSRGEAPAAPGRPIPGSIPAPINLYAGFWRRVAAYLVDYGLLLIATFVIAVVLGLGGVSEDTSGVLLTLFLFFGFWLYCAIMESSVRQATLGKVALGISVTDKSGGRIGFGRATGRYFGEVLSSMTFGIGYVMSAFTKQRQALHDMVASTLVVNKTTTPEQLAANAVAPFVPVWAVVLLVLVGSLAPIGILAAIAIPAYQDYLIRAQVSEGLIAASGHKVAVVEAAVMSGRWDDINSGTLDLSSARTSQYVESFKVVRGVVVITYGGAASRNLAGNRIVLVPGMTDGGDVVWTCGLAPVPDGVEPALDGHEEYTSVPQKYLPAVCRSQSG
jgi:uncharacterized RDD family membrane protein YckC